MNEPRDGAINYEVFFQKNWFLSRFKIYVYLDTLDNWKTCEKTAICVTYSPSRLHEIHRVVDCYGYIFYRCIVFMTILALVIAQKTNKTSNSIRTRIEYRERHECSTMLYMSVSPPDAQENLDLESVSWIDQKEITLNIIDLCLHDFSITH